MATRAGPAAALELQKIPPLDRHARIFSTFRDLVEGETLQLVDERALDSVYYQFQVERPTAFVWDYLERGPDVWRASVTRLAVRVFADSRR